MSACTIISCENIVEMVVSCSVILKLCIFDLISRSSVLFYSFNLIQILNIYTYANY